MKYLLTVLAGLTLIASGCKKEKENVDTRRPKRLAKIIKQEEQMRTVIEFSYDKDGYLSKQHIVSEDVFGRKRTREISYKRDAGHKITEEINTGDNNSQTGTYLYNNNGQVSRVDYRNENNTSYAYIFTWEGDRMVSLLVDAGYEFPFSLFSNIYDHSGNIIEVRQTQIYSPNKQVITDIKYDNTPNPISTIKGKPVYMYVYGQNFQNYSTNNLLSARVQQMGRNETQNYSLEYDIFGNVVRESQNGSPQYREFVYENY